MPVNMILLLETCKRYSNEDNIINIHPNEDNIINIHPYSYFPQLLQPRCRLMAPKNTNYDKWESSYVLHLSSAIACSLAWDYQIYVPN